MPRKSASRVRADLPLKHHRPGKQRVIPGISLAAQRQIADFERRRASPGALAEALATWAQWVRRPARDYHGGVLSPWRDHLGERSLLSEALHAVPPRARRELRPLVRRLDEHYLRRTFDTRSTSTDDWWPHRRRPAAEHYAEYALRDHIPWWRD
ncbi:hypothetical protein [Amycolatopsis samaneae]|uniref:Uncharacterized protein n=1 Tax=Amycolatopsis samaneae TaxID=664691 RepID=A0ABW5GBJ4_9PSEU